MTYPTAEEIRLAHEAIEKAGPIAPETVALGKMCITDPVLRSIIDRIAGDSGPISKSRVMAAMMGGLNIMLRIQEQRAKPR